MEHWKNKSTENLTEIVDGVLMIEEWSSIKGYENIYEVSSFGRIKMNQSFPCKKYAGKIKFQRIKKRWVRGKYIGTYLNVKLVKDNIEKDLTVHRLVAQAFISNPENKPEVNHKKGIKTDNRAWELEWSTSKENSQHAYKTGLMKPVCGEKNKQAKITSTIALEIFNDKRTHVEIAKTYGLYPATVGFIKKGETWSHVTGKKYIRKRFTEEIIVQLRKDALTMNKKQLSLKYGRRIKYIEEVLSRKLWKNIA